MAVFGAPAAHEDDPERAVRAALAIRDAVDDLDLRTAVNTGEALVALERAADRGRGMVSGDVVNTAARMQTAAPVERHPRRRRDVSRDAERDRVPRGGADRGEGQGRAGAGLGGGRGALALRRRRRRAPAHVARRPRARARRARGRAGALAARARAAARHARRRPGHRQEPARRGAVPGRRPRPGADLVAAGPLAPVRRGPELLGARRDREGAGGHPRDGRGRRGRGEARRRCSTTSSPDAAERDWIERARAAARRPAAPPTAPAATGAPRRTPPGGGCSRRSPSSVRSSSSSRTCTGPTTGCSTSSTTSPSGPAACRC